ncbi:MAG TPA: T9SS type A sorting domain-containing protein [bacterium (Candidatus Stahlbacteria)]|nr:T9SS type A sorting domain-containing protein [Candidatus Stahlbacteria bacterium]
MTSDAQNRVWLVWSAMPQGTSSFNQVLQIYCTLPRSSKVLIKIYDISGRPVRTLVDERVEAGLHTLSWDGKDSAGREVPSGIYLCRLQAGEFAETKKLILLR